MSCTIETLIHCDGCGENHGSDCRNETAGSQRKWLVRDYGWYCGPKGDYCQQCRKTHGIRSRAVRNTANIIDKSYLVCPTCETPATAIIRDGRSVCSACGHPWPGIFKGA